MRVMPNPVFEAVQNSLLLCVDLALSREHSDTKLLVYKAVP